MPCRSCENVTREGAGFDMNHYTKSIWVLTLGMAAQVIAFLSPLFGILFGIAAIILGKKTMSEAKSKMAYAGFWIGIAAVAIGIAFWIISVIYLL